MTDSGPDVGRARWERPRCECIAVCCPERWAAVVAGEVAVDAGGLSSPEEARAALLAARKGDSDRGLAELPEPPAPG